MTEIEAFLVLNAVPELGSVRIRKLIDHFGSADKALSATVSMLVEVEGIGRKIANNMANWEKYFDLKKELEFIEKHKVNIIVINNPEYPLLLKEIYDPPAVLYIKGNIQGDDKGLPSSLQGRGLLSIVGARRASYYGINTARRFAMELSARGFTIVSGFARGVDTAAHEGAIRGNGRTIAVFGCGIDKIYPPENYKLVSEIIQKGGAIISEFPFGTPPHKQNFPKRNRIISGLSLGVIIVEAGRYSGSLITARLAGEQGREVFSVPGRIDAITSSGTNILIKNGAKPVFSVDDILEEFNYAPQITIQTKEEPKISGLSEIEDKLFQTLHEEPYTVDEIVDNTDLPVNEIWTNLVNLELKGLVKRLPGSRFVRK